MKKLLILGLCIALASCGTEGMQGNPGAIMVGAQVGGTLGSIIGGSSDNYGGWAIGNILGTIAGAAIGNAVSTPHNNTVAQQSTERSYSSDDQYPQRADNGRTSEYGSATGSNSGYGVDNNSDVTSSEPTLPLMIENIRFVDENNDHVIQSKEVCKLIFIIHNTGNQTLYNVYPTINLSNRKVGASSPLIIDKIEAGARMKYTASMYGFSDLRDGNVTVTLSVTQQNGGVGDTHQFTLETRR